MKQTVHDLSYPWPPNLTAYEATLFFGLSAVEAIAGALAFVLPLAIVENKVAAALVGALVAGAVLLSLRRVARLGDLPLPVYLYRRLAARRRARVVEMPLILGASGGEIHVETDAGETLVTLEEAWWPSARSSPST